MTMGPFGHLSSGWRNLPIVAKASLAIAGPLLVLAASFDLFTAKARSESATQRHLVQTIAERESLDRLLHRLLIMESALRTYLLNRDPVFKTRYFSAREGALAELHRYGRMRSGTGRNAESFSSLHSRVLEKLGAAEELLSTSSLTPTADPPIFRSTAAMEKVQQSIWDLEDAAERLQAADLKTLAEFHQKTIIGTTFAMGIGVVISGASVFLFGRSLSRRLRALQVDVRAIKFEMPLEASDECADELGLLRSELQKTSERLANRASLFRASEGQAKAIGAHLHHLPEEAELL